MSIKTVCHIFIAGFALLPCLTPKADTVEAGVSPGSVLTIGTVK